LPVGVSKQNNKINAFFETQNSSVIHIEMHNSPEVLQSKLLTSSSSTMTNTQQVDIDSDSSTRTQSKNPAKRQKRQRAAGDLPASKRRKLDPVSSSSVSPDVYHVYKTEIHESDFLYAIYFVYSLLMRNG
jgi:hypothetical protein